MQLTSAFRLRRRSLGIAALLTALALAVVYGPGLGNGLVFDDSALTDGHIFGPYGSLLPLQPRLLSYGSFVWLQNLVGESWAIQRGLNVLLHGSNCVVLFFFIRELLALPAATGSDTGDEAESARRAAAVVATGFFALHPVAVYGVAYLVQRSIVMATLFGLLACLSYLRGLRGGGAPWFVAAFASYVIAVLCKEHAVTIAALSVPFYCYVRRPAWQRLLALVLLALGTLVAIAYLLTLRYGTIVGAHAFDDTSREFVRQLEALQPGIGEHVYGLSVLNQAWLFFRYAALWALPNIQWMAIDLRPAFPLSYGAFPQLFGALGYLALMLACTWLVIRRRDSWGLGALLVLSAGLLFATEFSTSWIQDPFVLYRSYLWAPMLCGLLALVLTKLQARTIYSMGAVGKFSVGFFRETRYCQRPMAPRLAAADVAIAGLGPGGRDAEGDQGIATCQLPGLFHHLNECGLVGDGVIRRHHQQHRVITGAGIGERLQCRQRQRGCCVAAGGLQDHAGMGYACLGQLPARR